MGHDSSSIVGLTARSLDSSVDSRSGAASAQSSLVGVLDCLLRCLTHIHLRSGLLGTDVDDTITIDIETLEAVFEVALLALPNRSTASVETELAVVREQYRRSSVLAIAPETCDGVHVG